MADYDLVYLAGGWGAAFDFGTSDALAELVTQANARGRPIGGVCHGPLGLCNATRPGRPAARGGPADLGGHRQAGARAGHRRPRRCTPRRELRAQGARFESAHRFRDPLANHWVVDGNLVTGQNQNAGPMVARELMRLVQAGDGNHTTAEEAAR